MRLLGFLVWTLLTGTAVQDKPVTLRFSYAPGDRENIRMELRMTTSSEAVYPKVITNRKSEGPISLVLRKACLKAEEESFVFDAKVADLELKQLLEDERGRIEVSLKGDEVVMKTDDGRKLIDTKGGIQADKAGPILQKFASLKGNLELELDKRGLVRGLEKNPKLSALLGGAGNDNLYPIILPEHPVDVGEEWTHANKLHTFGDIVLAGDPLEVPFQCKLERMEGDIAVLSTAVKAEFKNIKGKGKIENIQGEKTVTFSNITLSGKGETRFHTGKGRIVRSEMEMTILSAMILEVEELGGAGMINVKLNARAKMTPEAVAAEEKD